MRASRQGKSDASPTTKGQVSPELLAKQQRALTKLGIDSEPPQVVLENLKSEGTGNRPSMRSESDSPKSVAEAIAQNHGLSLERAMEIEDEMADYT